MLRPNRFSNAFPLGGNLVRAMSCDQFVHGMSR
jgi:hypothetical protein